MNIGVAIDRIHSRLDEDAVPYGRLNFSPYMSLHDRLSDGLADLLFIAVTLVVFVHELITGEVSSSFGGWVTRREKEPEAFQKSLRMLAFLLLFLFGRLIYDLFWNSN